MINDNKFIHTSGISSGTSKFWSANVGVGGAGVLPYKSHIWFLRRFDLKAGIYLSHFDLESDIVFEGFSGVYEGFFLLNSKQKTIIAWTGCQSIAGLPPSTMSPYTWV